VQVQLFPLVPVQLFPLAQVRLFPLVLVRLFPLAQVRLFPLVQVQLFPLAQVLRMHCPGLGQQDRVELAAREQLRIRNRNREPLSTPQRRWLST